ncbi:MAG TPA: TonB-dependent receptor [Bryobacteraceae bacterium]|nr:TonB-dependent receptor [Bryobacteraceae bacterium]
MRTLVFLTLSLAAFAGETSNIHGTILDPSGRPVEGARVSCQNQTVFSNAEGRFTIPGAGKCDAHVEKAGFQTATPVLVDATEARLTLAIAGPVATVTVSATRAESTPEQAAVASTVITERQIAADNFPMVFDLLREVPGVQVSEYGRPGSLAQVYTRGAERTGTLFLLDGVPLNDPGGELHTEHLSSEGIDRIEVVRGPQSALYGAEAAAGVVQLFTKRGDPENKVPHGAVSYERGNFQTDRWIASLTGGYQRLDYSFSAAELHTAGEFQNDFYRDNSGSANLGYKISEATQLRGVFRIYDAHSGTPGQTAYGVDNLSAHEQERNSTVSLRLDDSRGANYLQRFTFGFNRLTDRFDDNSQFSTQPLAAFVRDVPGPPAQVFFVDLLNPLALPTASQIPPGLRIAKGTAFFGSSHSLNLTERRSGGYQGTLSHRGGVLVFGYEYQKQLGDLSSINVDRDNNGLFANVQQSIGGRLFLSGGARMEHSSAFGTSGSGRGGASFLLAGEHGALSSATFRVDGGRGVTEPSLLENFARSPFFHGNPALVPEETTTGEAAIVSEWFGRRIRTEVDGFRNSFHNLIAFVGNTWQNVQASWARGIETSVQSRVHKNVLITAGYMRLYTRITSSVSPPTSSTGLGHELARRPRNSGFMSVAVTPRRWSFVMGGRFIGERQDVDFSFGVTRNPGFENVYASASYDLARHFTPVFRVDNLLNERYQGVLGYQALSRRVIGGVRIHW